MFLSLTNDRQILKGCMAGDKKCWTEFFSRYNAYIKNAVRYAAYAHAKELNLNDQEDIAQEVLKKMLDHAVLEKLIESKSLKAYLYVICLNEVRDAYRRWLRVHSQETSFEDHSLLETQAASETILELSESHSLESIYSTDNWLLVDGAMKSLSSDQRLSLELIYRHELTYEDAARAMGLKKEGFATLLKRAKLKLKTILQSPKL